MVKTIQTHIDLTAEERDIVKEAQDIIKELKEELQQTEGGAIFDDFEILSVLDDLQADIKVVLRETDLV